ncbi:MAG: hypothetical protein WA957_00885 [Alteraurantiacibacter sp.]
MIKTSHVGSLPRSENLVPLLLARDKGETYDAEEFDRVVQEAVTVAVRQQVEAGVSVVSDGELGRLAIPPTLSSGFPALAGTPRVNRQWIWPKCQNWRRS